MRVVCGAVFQMDPNFVVACWSFDDKHKCCRCISNALCFRMSHSDWNLGDLTNPQTSVHLLGTSPGPPTKGKVPGGTGSFAFLNSLFKCTAEVLI